MEDVLRAVVLGVIQGLTEFLPISSSGHLIVARELFGWEFADDLTFDVALHLGTTAAVIAFFWSEWLAMLRSGWRWLASRRKETGARTPEPEASAHRAVLGNPGDDPDTAYDARLLGLLLIGSVPAAIAGLFFDIVLDVRSPVVVGVMLIVFGIVIYVIDHVTHGRRDVASADLPDAAWVGTAQAVSLVPGVSRSGITMSAAMVRGFSREQAARFSFLLATPAILGAGLLKGLEAGVEGIPTEDIAAIIAGAVTSAVVGWLSIRFLLRLLQTGTFTPFVVYRLIAGVFVVAYFSV
jgi:undecaprenyl-diphosphatase